MRARALHACVSATWRARPPRAAGRRPRGRPCTQATSTRACVSQRVTVCVCVCVCVSVCLCVCVRARAFARSCMRAWAHPRVCACSYQWVYTHAPAHTRTLVATSLGRACTHVGNTEGGGGGICVAHARTFAGERSPAAMVPTQPSPTLTDGLHKQRCTHAHTRRRIHSHRLLSALLRGALQRVAATARRLAARRCGLRQASGVRCAMDHAGRRRPRRAESAWGVPAS